METSQAGGKGSEREEEERSMEAGKEEGRKCKQNEEGAARDLGFFRTMWWRMRC